MLKEARRQGAAASGTDAGDPVWSFIALVELVCIANALGLDVPFTSRDAYLDLVDRLLATVSAASGEEV